MPGKNFSRTPRFLPCLLFASAASFANPYLPDNIGPGDKMSGTYSLTIAQTGNTPVIRVQSDGKKYTSVKPGQSILWQGKSRGVCRAKRRIYRYQWWLNDNSKMGPISHSNHHVRLVDKKWITSKSNRDKFETSGQLSLPVTGKLANEAVKACNSHLQAELGKGRPLQSVMSEDRTLDAQQNQNPLLAGVVRMQCGSSPMHDTHSWQNVRINYLCEGFDFPKPARANMVVGQLAAPFLLEQPKIQLTPDKYSGQCPVDIAVKGTLKASQGQKKVQYRWSHNGALGPVNSATLNTSGWRSVNTVLKDIGKSAAGPGKTLAVQQQKPGNGGQPGQVNSGFVQLLALAEGADDWSKARKSAKAFYRANCKEPMQAVKAKVALPVQQSDLTPGNTLTVGNASAPWGSKLAVDASRFNGRKRGDRCELRMAYDVKNIGNGNSGKSVSRLFEQAQTLHQASLPPLAAGTTKKVSGTIYLNDGSHLLGVSVDDQQQVDESNEGNNKRRITVEVRGCGSSTGRSARTAPPPRQ